MDTDAVPRPSTDLESAPLLAHHAAHDGEAHHPQRPLQSFFKRLTSPTRELTVPELVLLGVALFFLLGMSTFIGLFAGAENQIKNGGAPVQTTTTTLVSTTTTTSASTPTGVPLPPKRPEEAVCVTKECVLLAGAILNNIDPSVDPCEDFYQFANGGWEKANPLPASKSVWGSFNAVQDRNSKIISEILKAATPDSLKYAKKDSEEDKATKDNLKKMKDVFDSCMDEDLINKVGSEPLLDIINDVRTLFPISLPLQPSSMESDESSAEKAAPLNLKLTTDFIDLVMESIESVKAKIENVHAESNKVASKVFVEKRSMAKEEEGEETSGLADEALTEKLTKVLSYLHSRDITALFGFNVEGDVGRAPQFQVLSFYQADLGLPSKEYYEEAPIRALYESVLLEILKAVDLASLLEGEKLKMNKWGFPWPFPGRDPNEKGSAGWEKELAKRVTAVVDLEVALGAAGADLEDLYTPAKSYNPTSFSKLAKKLPIDLQSYVSSFAPRNFPESIIVTHPPYIKSLNKIISNTTEEVLQAYFVLQTALKFGGLLGEEEKIKIQVDLLSNTLRGIKPGNKEPREDICLRRVSSVVGHLEGSEFIKVAFPGDSKAQAEKVIWDIIGAFKDRLTEIPWMDKESSDAAIGKADAIVPKIGYPLSPNNTNPVVLRTYYARQVVDPKDFFGNVLRATLMESIRAWQVTLGNNRNVNAWEMYASTVNAYFSPPDNEIVFPAGILQPPFFQAGWPKYSQYGAFGAVAAHELGHAFDNNGALYDSEGFYRSWWTNSTVAAFQERSQCIARQYSDFYVLDADGKKVYVNGNLTNGEDIGDSGLRFAYKAWQTTLNNTADNLKLPGLPFNKEQMFFLAFGAVWAQNISPAAAVSRVRTDPHSPNQFRVLGTLRNFEKFAEVFQCKKGSNMNPKERCELW